MCGFSHFNQILLSLFKISNNFPYNIWVVYHHLTHFHLKLAKKLSWNTFEMSNKIKKIWLKGLIYTLLKLDD